MNQASLKELKKESNGKLTLDGKVIDAQKMGEGMYGVPLDFGRYAGELDFGKKLDRVVLEEINKNKPDGAIAFLNHGGMIQGNTLAYLIEFYRAKE